jgi:branched-chain amino acid transport system permease protein
MIVLQLFINGLVTGCALGMVAVSFSLIYSTTKIFHVAHAGVFTLAGYVAWSLAQRGAPDVVSLLAAMLVCALFGAAIQKFLYEPLDRRQAPPLVILIASLGALAVIVNVLAAIYSANILQYPTPWASQMMVYGGIRLTNAQLLTVATGIAAYVVVMIFAHGTILGKRIRAVASNPLLADITRLQPKTAYVIVLAIASALVAIPGVLVHLDLGLQPWNGINVLLTATIAMIAGGVGSITGAFVMAIAVAVLQNLSLLVIPSIWSIGVTFFIFVIFMLFRPTGLFVQR